MAVVETESIIKLIKDNDLLSSCYNESKLASDLNSSFYVLNYTNAREIVDLIKSTTPAKIKNKHDLSVLSLTIDEAKERYELYKNYDSSLSLKSFEDLNYNPKKVIAKLEYCKRFNYPYADEDGRILEEIVQENKSKSCLLRFETLYRENFDINKVGEYDYFLDQIKDDKISELFAIIQTISYKYFNRLCYMTEGFENSIKELLNEENIDLNVLAYTSLQKLKENNPFIDESIINNNYNFEKNEFTEFHRNGQR